MSSDSGVRPDSWIVFTGRVAKPDGDGLGEASDISMSWVGGADREGGPKCSWWASCCGSCLKPCWKVKCVQSISSSASSDDACSNTGSVTIISWQQLNSCASYAWYPFCKPDKGIDTDLDQAAHLELLLKLYSDSSLITWHTKKMKMQSNNAFASPAHTTNRQPKFQ